MTKAIIDRFEDNQKVVLMIESIGKEIILDQKALPLGASRGDIIDVDLSSDGITIKAIDAIATEQTKKRIQTKLDRLRQKNKGSQINRYEK